MDSAAGVVVPAAVAEQAEVGNRNNEQTTAELRSFFMHVVCTSIILKEIQSIASYDFIGLAVIGNDEIDSID